MGHLIDGPARGLDHAGLHHNTHHLAQIDGSWWVYPQEWQAKQQELLRRARGARWSEYQRRDDTWGLPDADATWVFVEPS